MLSLKNISKRYRGCDDSAVSNLSFTIDNELLTIVGPSGCGKTTTLRLIAGLENPDSGELILHGQNLLEIPPRKRDVGFVFQDAVLYPAMTVEQNLEFAGRSNHTDKERLQDEVRRVASELQLENFLDRMPDEISGGERQRASIGRVLLRQPKMLLLDEPLSNLDGALRQQLRILIRNVFEKLRVPTIYVTHDQEEALSLGDRVAVMHRGQIQQIDFPTVVYRAPSNRFVASITGHPPMNVLRSEIWNGNVPLNNVPLNNAEMATHIGIRPEHIRCTSDDGYGAGQGTAASSDLSFSGRIVNTQYIGNGYLITVRVANTDSNVIVRVDNAPKDAAAVQMFVARTNIHLFAADGSRLN